jgi:tetratricopeptide (TPR) repeat protein
VEPLQLAAAAPLPGEAGERQRLTYNMNLGDVLDRLDRLDEAEQVLRDGLQGRERLYGRAHPGYAFGLEPLSAVLFRKGKVDEALEAINGAVRLLWDDGNPRVAMALATRAPIATAAGGTAFAEAPVLPDEIFDQLVQEVLARADRDEPALHLVVLQELQETISSRRGASDPAIGRVLAAMGNAAREAGQADVRIAVLRVLVAWLDQRDDRAQALAAVLGLGQALDEAAEPDAARQAYEDACTRAEQLGAAADAEALVARTALQAMAQRMDQP